MSKILKETEDYVLRVKVTVAADLNNPVYAIINKVTDVTEAEVPFLVQALEGITEMQGLLDKYRATELNKEVGDNEKSDSEPVVIVS